MASVVERARRIALILLVAVLNTTVGQDAGPHDYGLVKRSPTTAEIEANAVRFSVGEGYRCEVKGTRNETARAVFTERALEGSDCTPAKWTDWSFNCNGESDLLSVCDGSSVRNDLGELKFTGAEDCFLLNAAINADDPVMMNDLEEECRESHRTMPESGGVRSRRLDYVTSCSGNARRYLANWYIRGAQSFHFHARNLLDNIKGWGNCGSGDYDVYSGRPTFHSIGIAQSLTESVYEGDWLWNCETQDGAFVRVLGNLAYFEGGGTRRTGSTDCTIDTVGSEIHLYPSSGDRCYSGISWDTPSPASGLTPTIPVVRSGYGGSGCF